MAEEFDEEVKLQTFSPEQIAQIKQADAARAAAVPDVIQARQAKQKIFDALRKKYPLPDAGFYSVENVGLEAYLELAVNAYAFDPTGDYRPPLDPLPKGNEPGAQILGMGHNSLPKSQDL